MKNTMFLTEVLGKEEKRLTFPLSVSNFTLEHRLSRMARKMRTGLLSSCLLLASSIVVTNKVYALSGGGSSSAPFLIATAADLDEFRGNINGGNSQFNGSTVYYKLTANITSSSSWERIGNSTGRAFKSHFDGDGHTISLPDRNFGSSTDYCGFFGVTEGATIENLTLVCGYIHGKEQVGALIGEARGNLTLANVHVTQSGVSYRYGESVGGFIGKFFRNGGTTIYIKQCSYVNTGTLQFRNGKERGGGFVGRIDAGYTSIRFIDCLVKTTNMEVYFDNKWFTKVGGFFGSVASDVSMTRCVQLGTVATDYHAENGTNALSRNMGYLAGHLEKNITITCNGVYIQNSPGAVVAANATITGKWSARSSWTSKQVYEDLERKNDSYTDINSTVHGNELWRKKSTDVYPMPDTAMDKANACYMVKVVKGANVKITGQLATSGDNYYQVSTGKLTISPATTPASTQQVQYTFIPEYDCSNTGIVLPGTGDTIREKNYTAYRSGNDWVLTPKVSGTVSASFINLPYPKTINNLKFEKWDQTVTFSFTYENPQNIGGNFYVYYRDASSGSNPWRLLSNDGCKAEIGSVTRTIDVVHGVKDLNVPYQYMVGFKEGTIAPSDYTDIEAALRKTSGTVSTTAALGTWKATATGDSSSITVEFNADSHLEGNNYSYDIDRRANGTGPWVSLLNPPGKMIGETLYSYKDNFNLSSTSSCDYYEYRVTIHAFGTTFVKETNESSITGVTRFLEGSDGFTASKGEYANYVRLQWKVNKQPGGLSETYRVFRRVANTNDPYVEQEIITSNDPVLYWNDNNALTGIYYEYKVTIYQTCSNVETVGESHTDLGFTQAFGTVLGRITYGSGVAVENVDVLVRKNDIQNTGNSFHSLYSDGSGQKFEFNHNAVSDSSRYTLQFWLNPSSMTGASLFVDDGNGNYIPQIRSTVPIGSVGGYAIGLAPAFDTIRWTATGSAEAVAEAEALGDLAEIPPSRGSLNGKAAGLLGVVVAQDPNVAVSVLQDTTISIGKKIPGTSKLGGGGIGIGIGIEIKTKGGLGGIKTSQSVVGDAYTIIALTNAHTMAAGSAEAFSAANGLAFSTAEKAALTEYGHGAQTYHVGTPTWVKAPPAFVTPEVLSTPVFAGFRVYMASQNNPGSIVVYSEVIPANQYSHIAITRNGDTCRIYTVNDRDPSNIFMDSVKTFLLAALPFDSADYLGGALKGNIDDVRFWDRPLTEAEIKNNYNRSLAGNENGLKGYYTFNDVLPGYAFDISRVNTVYNGNHALSNYLDYDENVPDETYQLGLRGVTDANGYYQINGIPFTDMGSSYSIVPTMGVHVFEPTEEYRYISPQSMVHNGTNFTDKSSFTVQGYVTYDGGTYPVEGCSFEVDGLPVILNGKPVTSDAYGKWEISVPVGIHEVRIVKNGHTFANDGLLQEVVWDLANGGPAVDPATGDTIYKNINYVAPMANIALFDQTLVKLVGRVTGSKTENDKPLGFGESINNIGVRTLTLNSTREGKNNFINQPDTAYYYHNEGQWQRTNANELLEDSNRVVYHPDKIEISVSPITGEFVAYVYPEPYNIANIEIPGDGAPITIYNLNEQLNLTDAVVVPMGDFSEEDMMKTSVRTVNDSNWVYDQPGVADHWEYYNFSDTVRYNAEWKYYYQTTPTFDIVQSVDNNRVDYFGEDQYVFTDDFTGLIDTIPLYDHNTGVYFFGKPVFMQAEEYTFELNAFEEYVNYGVMPYDTVRYPVKDGKVNMTNLIDKNEYATIELDENGEGTYVFTAGAPNLTDGYNSFSATLTLGSISYYSKLGPNGVDAWHLGGRVTGTNFMTAGPDQVEIILRDPPGTKSKASIEQGTTTTTTSSLSIGLSTSESLGLTLKNGGGATFWVGFGMALQQKIEITADATVTASGKMETTGKMGHTMTTTYTETIETSSGDKNVGAPADVFVGYSTNLLYGMADAITILKNDPDSAFIRNGVYSIGTDVSMAIGQSFATRFVFTQKEIEDIMIPKWKQAISVLLANPGTVPNTAFITAPVYVSNLYESDPNFGKLNTDIEAFGLNASKWDSCGSGPSYTIYFPDNYDMTLFETDSMMYYNNQINNWEHILYLNEEEKVNTTYDNNYSFGGAVSIKVSESTSASTQDEFSMAISVSAALATKYGATKDKTLGVMMETKSELKNDYKYSDGITEKTDIKTSFTLEDGDSDDEYTVDYGMSESGTFVFKTRGGQTSCPYEGEYKTKYYQPDQHVINEATMKIEEPRISIQQPDHALGVPANKAATFIIAMQNESQIGKKGTYKLVVDEESNPNGTILKIDGAVLTGEGRSFTIPFGSTVYKTLTVEKGTVDNDSIVLKLKSTCDSKISAETKIWFEFVPGVSDVAIASPLNNWILNTDNATGDTFNITINDYDVNFPNFGYIRLDYRAVSSPTWSTITTFYPSYLYPKAQGVAGVDKQDIGLRTQIVYPWDTKTVPDGAYELRATAYSVNIASDSTIMGGPPLSSYSTEAVAGYKDLHRPVSLGYPSPANGILGIGDELSITFNEDIRSGILNDWNFSITGILNEQEIAEPNVGISFTSGNDFAETELPIYAGGSFSIETWFKHDVADGGMLFAFGDDNNSISLGFDASGHAVVSIGGQNSGIEPYTSTAAIAHDETWKFIAMTYNRDSNTVSVYEFEGDSNKLLFVNKVFTNYPPIQGRLVVGNNIRHNYGFGASNSGQAGEFGNAVAQLHFYSIKRDYPAVAADKSKSKSGREYGLIGYWLMDEGEGNTAKDKARSRHLTLSGAGLLSSAAGWYIYPAGYSIETDGANYLAIPISTHPLNMFCDFTLEFWFKDNGNGLLGATGTIFSTDKFALSYNSKAGLDFSSTTGNGMIAMIRGVRTTSDRGWHHFVLSVKRGGNANVYIDGLNTASFDESLIGDFSGAYIYFGGLYTPPNTYSSFVTGFFDEIRLWNSALTLDNILLNKNTKLRGDEKGLLAYYPFETYEKQLNGRMQVAMTDRSMTDTADVNLQANLKTVIYSTDAASVKDVRPEEAVPFTYVASNNKIVFTLQPDYFARVEGVVLNIAVDEVYDMHNNKSSAERWTAYVNRNPLRWDSDPVILKIQEGDTASFTARIANVGGTTVSYSIENLPAWLSVNSGIGTLQPLANKDLTFTVTPGTNIGSYETTIGLTSGNGVTEILPVQLKVTGVRPDWTVNPYDFEYSMNITGQIQIEGIFQEDPDDLLAAFIGDTCVGLTSPVYVKINNAYFTFADIYGNAEHINAPLRFKLWDASTGRIYPVVQTSVTPIIFTPSQIYGSTVSPVLFDALDYAEQIIPLKKGWTWVSSHLSTDNAPFILDQIKTSLSSVGVLIKGQNAYIQQPGWLGTLADISAKSMYIVNANNDHSLILAGKYVRPDTAAISIVQDWNWIGYVPILNLPVQDALAGINAQAGDQIKGQIGYATYTGSDWIGSLNYMEPGKGYMYYSAVSFPRTFNYPSSYGGTYSPLQQASSPLMSKAFSPFMQGGLMGLNNASPVVPKWSENSSSFVNNMTLTGIVLNGGVEMSSDMVEVGAFCGNDCRGSAFLQYEPSLSRYVCYLMIYGNGGELIELKVHDHDLDTTYNASNAAYPFVANNIYGDPALPYVVEVGKPSDASLSNLAVSQGVLSPAFGSDTLYYTVNVPYSVSALTLTATATDPTAFLSGDTGLLQLQTGTNIFTVNVTARDSASVLIYTVTVNRDYNDDATLSALNASAGALNPVFHSDTLNYAVNVPYSVASVTLSSTATDPIAVITGDTGSHSLQTGTNIFTIAVTAEDGITTLNYKVTVTRAYNDDATLSALNVSAGALNPVFHSDTLNYAVNVPYSVKSITLSATATDPIAAISGDTGSYSLQTGANSFTIAVTAEDGITTLNYKVTVTRAYNDDASLSALNVSLGSLNPVFHSDTLNYAVNVPYYATSITLSATATDPIAVIAGDTGSHSLQTGTNSFTIAVTAEDGITTLNYKVTVTRAYNDDATLSALAVSAGSLNPAFNKYNLFYTVNVPYNVASIALSATATDPIAVIAGDTGSHSLQTGANIFTIAVTAEDGITTLNYTVTVTRDYNDDATLSALNASAGALNPVFHSDTLNYAVNVPYNVASITLSATATDPIAVISGDIGLQQLQTGTNIFTIAVTAEDGITTLNYTVTVTRAYNDDATLSALNVSAGALNPVFHSDTLNYAVNVPYSVKSITLSATATDPIAVISGDIGLQQLQTGVNIFTIAVTAEDGITTLHYTVTVTRDYNDDATLSALNVSLGSLNPVFHSDTLNYAVNVPYAVASITLSATATDPIAVISGDIGLQQLQTGTNIFTIAVTAEDGITTLHYTVTVTRDYNDDASLSALNVSAGALNPVFHSDTLNYAVNVPYNVASITLSATATDPIAVIAGDTGLHSLQTGINIFTIAVTAEDGITTLNYKVTVTRDYNNDATLSELALSEGTLDAEFNSTHYVYTTDVVEGMEEVTLTAVPTDTNATVTGAGLITISSGTNVLVVTVTAQDKVTESNYIIVVNRTVGIDEPTQTDAKLVVYPNPTTGKLTIKCAETLHATSVQMFNVVGQVVGTWHTAPENTETTIDVSHLAKGMYFLKVDGEMFKVVKE